MELDSLHHPCELTFPTLNLNFPSCQMVKISLALPSYKALGCQEPMAKVVLENVGTQHMGEAPSLLPSPLCVPSTAPCVLY